jgi:hypothetical protein
MCVVQTWVALIWLFETLFIQTTLLSFQFRMIVRAISHQLNFVCIFSSEIMIFAFVVTIFLAIETVAAIPIATTEPPEVVYGENCAVYAQVSVF